MNELDALRLQIEWGADEAIADAPIDRLAPERPAPASPRRARPAAPVAARAQTLADAANTVDELKAALAAFDGCPLRATASSTVWAEGNAEAGLVVVGEAPGTEDDRSGRPFSGPGGQLLDRMWDSIGLDRSQLLVTMLVPWRPPGGRAPTEAEVQACLPFLLRHLALIRPLHLVLLGGMAAKALAGSTEGVRRVRGKWLSVAVPGLDAPIPALAMLPPEQLIRTQAAKRDAWIDLLTLRRTLDAGS